MTWLSPSEQPTKHAHRQEEARAGGTPPLWPSKEMPPPGTIVQTRGWWVSADPHVCGTEVMPIRAPKCVWEHRGVDEVSGEHGVVLGGNGDQHRAARIRPLPIRAGFVLPPCCLAFRRGTRLPAFTFSFR